MNTENLGMDCVVVGGCANGTLLRNVRLDAKYVELKRPTHIKPLESPSQDVPDIHHEKDIYEIHPISFVDSEVSNPNVFGIAVIQDMPLTWAFTQLVASHIELTTQKIVAAGLLDKG